MHELMILSAKPTQCWKRSSKVVIVDFHAEATSEKMALGWYLDGRVTAVVGTHTHIPTADEQSCPAARPIRPTSV